MAYSHGRYAGPRCAAWCLLPTRRRLPQLVAQAFGEGDANELLGERADVARRPRRRGARVEVEGLPLYEAERAAGVLAPSAERLDGEGAEVEPTLGAHIVHALVDTPVVRGDGNGLGALALRALVGGTTGLLVDGRIGGG